MSQRRDKGTNHLVADEIEATYALDAELPEITFDGVVVTDPWGTILFSNTSWASMHGLSPAQMLGQHLSICHNSAQIDGELNPFLEAARISGSHEGEINHYHQNGADFTVWQSASVLYSDRGEELGLLFIAQPLPDEEQTVFSPVLTENEHKNSLFDALPDGTLILEITFSADLRNEAFIHQANRAFSTISGFETHQLEGHQFREIFPNVEPALLHTFAQVAEEGSPVRIEFFFQDLNMHTEVTTFRVEPTRVACIFEDITDRQSTAPSNASEMGELRLVAARLSRDIERERHSLSGVLDARIKRHLSVLGMKLGMVQTLIDSGDRAQLESLVENAISQIGEMGQTIHAVLSRLSPYKLEEEGLFSALTWYAERYTKSTSLLVLVEGHPPSPRLDTTVELELFRIVEECLANIAQHAGASRAYVLVEEVPDAVVITVHDDGHGFDATALPPPHVDHGVGLVVVRERARRVGATMEIDTTVGQGTRVIITASRR